MIDPLLSQASENVVNRLMDNWPTTGIINMRKVKASYSPIRYGHRSKSQQQQTQLNETRLAELDEHENTFVVNGLTVDLKPQLKTAIVGRSNSGKSSLILALFRLIYLHDDSKIMIDGVDIRSVPLHRVSFISIGLSNKFLYIQTHIF